MLLTSALISESALAAYSIILKDQWAINISFNLWIDYFRFFALEDLIVYSKILKGQYAASISFNLQISFHKLSYNFLHFLNASIIFIYFHKSYTFSTVLSIELYAFFHKHICQQWNWWVTFFHLLLKWISKIFKNAFS